MDTQGTEEGRMPLLTEKASELLEAFLRLRQAAANPPGPTRLQRFEELLQDFKRLAPMGRAHSG